MHEHEGFFCKTGKSWDNAKFAELEKNIYGPNLHLGQQWKGPAAVAHHRLRPSWWRQADEAAGLGRCWTGPRPDHARARDAAQ